MPELNCNNVVENIMSYIDNELDQSTLFTLEKTFRNMP